MAQLCRAISSQLRYVSTIGIKLSSNMSSRCPHNMVNIGPLTAEICWRVWGTPANFNGFRVLERYCTAVQSSSEREPNFAALNRGRHLCSAGRPSRWALAYISSFILFFLFVYETSRESLTDLCQIHSEDVFGPSLGRDGLSS